MSRMRLTVKSAPLCWLVFVMAIGCGKSETPPGGQSPPPALGSETVSLDAADDGSTNFIVGDIPPTVSLGSSDDLKRPPAAPGASGSLEPDDGSPEWLLGEITRLRVRKSQPTDDPEKLRARRRWKNEKIIKLAQEAIRLSHNDSDQEQIFNTAVHQLMEARLELALQVTPEQLEFSQAQIEELYSDADALFRRAPKSKAAAEAAFVRAKFANTSAERFADREPRWLEEFTRQALLFATNFPQEQSRATSLLDAAGRSCELHRLRDKALNCYALLVEKFPETPEGKQATAILRRLSLNGKRLDKFGGPTIDRGFVYLDDFRGRIVVVVFWASHSRLFVEQLPKLIALRKNVGAKQLAMLGVSLDKNKVAAEEFLSKNELTEPTILWPDANRREWKNPIVQYYGVRDIPMYWLIDQQGVVVDSLLDVDQIEERVQTLLKQN